MVYLPDALHVGFSKCASTYLQAFFEGHPNIFLVNQSHFFAPLDHSGYKDGVVPYQRLFKSAQATQVKLESDEHIVLPLIHPVLCARATTLDSIVEVSGRIKAVQPDAKIVLVIRNQVDLIVSRYSQYIMGGGKYTFDHFVSEFINCSLDGINYFQNYYSQILEIFQNDFSKDNVLMLLQEELRQDEARFIEDLCSFLSVNVQPLQKKGLKSSRIGLSDLGLKTVRIFNHWVVIEQKLSFKQAKVKIPYSLYKSCLSAMRIIDYYLPKGIKGDKNRLLTHELGVRIRDEFRTDNARLAKLLGKDLSALGY